MAPASLKRKLGYSTGSSSRRKKAPAAAKRKRTKARTSAKAATTSTRTRDIKPSVASLQQQPPIVVEDLKAKVEYSPNAMAKCTKCRRKIQKQHKRFGIPEHSARYNKEIYRYYHVNCCPPALQKMVPNAVEQLKRQKADALSKEQVVIERQELHQSLKQMRLVFANRLEVPAFMVLANATLENLVFYMPTTSEEMLKIHGIGPTKLQNFGQPIMTLIRQYQEALQVRSNKHRVKKEQKRRPTASSSRNRASAAAAVIEIDLSDNEDDDIGGGIAVGKTLTCEELVNQKFEHAAANGYVISVE